MTLSPRIFNDPLFNDPFFSDPFFNDYGYGYGYGDYELNQLPRGYESDRTSGDYYGRGRDMGRRIPIQDRIPRHVGSRVMTEREGDTVWRPATDVYDTNEGVPKDEIAIDLRDREIVVSGERKRGPGYEAATSRVRERQIGKFRK
ncbi:14649_t:CDS:2, partial [Acaulospora colombiana]